MPKDVHIGLRISADLEARIQQRADKEGKSFSEAVRDGMQFWLDTTDNRIGADIIPFSGPTGVRLMDSTTNRKGKVLNTIALRDDPLGAMYDNNMIDDHQYEVGKHVAYHFEIARGNQPKSNQLMKENVQTFDDDKAQFSLPVKNRPKIWTLDDIRDARKFLRAAYRIVGSSRYAALRSALDHRDMEPAEPVNTSHFVQALNMLAPLCGYSNRALAA
jgi:hypothetical protein